MSDENSALPVSAIAGIQRSEPQTAGTEPQAMPARISSLLAVPPIHRPVTRTSQAPK